MSSSLDLLCRVCPLLVFNELTLYIIPIQSECMTLAQNLAAQTWPSQNDVQPKMRAIYHDNLMLEYQEVFQPGGRTVMKKLMSTTNVNKVFGNPSMTVWKSLPKSLGTKCNEWICLEDKKK